MIPLSSAFSAPNLAPFQSGVIAGRVATPAMDEAMRYESGGGGETGVGRRPPSSNELCLLVRIPDFTGFNFSLITDTKVWK